MPPYTGCLDLSGINWRLSLPEHARQINDVLYQEVEEKNVLDDDKSIDIPD